MNPEANDQDLVPSMTSTIEEDQATMRDADSNGQEDAVAVDPTLFGSSPDLSWSQSTIDTIPSVGNGTPVFPTGVALYSDRTPSWDPQETSVAVETTFGLSNGSSCEPFRPTSGASRQEGSHGFEILGELGHGGMGIVYKARQVRLKRLVALKMIRDEWHRNPEQLARFEIEAEAVARLSHPNIVRIYEIGRAGGVPFVVLELLEGGTLKHRLAGAPQPLLEAASLLCTLARAIHAAHVADILHRDLKPSNVLFDQDGVPKIADFGLAKRLEVEEGETRTGQVIGTPSYMSPEQAKGWDRQIGPAADIYSLGAILYEMLTGRPPFRGTTPLETLKLVLEEDPVPPSRLRPKLPFDLETICLKCLARDPRGRYASALALAEDLDRYVAGEPILARRTPLWQRAIKLARKRPVITVLLAVGIVMSGVTIGAVHLEQTRQTERVDRLLDQADQEIVAAQGALAAKSWGDVRRIVSGLLSRIKTESDSRLVRMRIEAQRLDGRAQRGLEEQTEIEQARIRFDRFVDFRDEALFLDSRFGGLDTGNALDATCRTARAGLGVFGLGAANDEWVLAALPPSLSPEGQDEVKTGFYELLLILADAVSQLPDDQTEERAHEALRIVDRAAGLRSPATRAYHLRRSAYLDRNGDNEEAAQERAQAEQLAPADAFDFFLLGRELMKKSEWAAAAKQFEAVTLRQPHHFWAQCLLAICHLQTNQQTEALIGLNACLQRKPSSIWLYLLRGIASTKEAEFDRNIAPRDSEQAASLASRASDKLKDAESDYRKALGLLGNRTDHAELHYVLLVNRGLIRLEQKDLAAAATDLQEAICLNDHRFEALSALGAVYQLQGRTGDALKQFTRAIELRPNWGPLYRGRADVLFGLKDLSLAQRDAALNDLELAIRYASANDSNNALDRIKQARLLRQAGRTDEALAACDAALEVAPRFVPAHLMRIQILLDQKRYDELLRSCDVALESGKRSAELYQLRAMAKDELKDYPGAIADYTQSLSLRPESPLLHRRRGWSYMASKAHHPALRDFEEAIRLAPTSADAYCGRGLARARLGRYGDAVSDAEEALKLGDSNWRIAYNAARIYAQAAIAAESESRMTGPVAVRLVNRYQDRAFELVRLALQRAPAEQRSKLLRDTMVPDPALQPIRRWLRSLENLDRVPPKPPPSSSPSS
jgi:eukaryotic-like serine/threonine-protein kinase